ncbi:MAG: hypothetical protein ABIJ41_05635 [Candidatus Omnitrophota bacterium]
MIKVNEKQIAIFVILLAIGFAVYFYYPSLLNKYIVADDVRVNSYWVPQYQDAELFKDDLLTQAAKYSWPWGYNFLYYLSSFFFEPVFFGTLLTIFLLTLAAYYIFKIGREIAGNYVGFLSALVFLLTPTYASRMAGGLTRTFAYPFLVMFLYYFIKKDYAKTLLALILQCLFYPMVFLLSILIYLFSFIEIPFHKKSFQLSNPKIKYLRGRGVSDPEILSGAPTLVETESKDPLTRDPSTRPSGSLPGPRLSPRSGGAGRVSPSERIPRGLKYFLLSIVICGLILGPKHLLSYDLQIGKAFTKKEMLHQPEFYRGIGRWNHGLPIAPLHFEVEKNTEEGNIFFLSISKYSQKLSKPLRTFGFWLILLAMIFFVAWEAFKKRICFPAALWFLLLSSVLMYKLADIFLFKLYVPNRYIAYPVPIISLLLFSVTLGQLMTKIKTDHLKRICQVLVIFLLLASFHIDRGSYLIDESANQDLYHYLNTLPRNVMIAAHPLLADNIPLYAQRKVFVNDETAVPLFDKYWNTIKKRLFIFFDLYYADNPLLTYKYCLDHHIDYLVVREGDFEKDFLKRGSFYFYPFNPFIQRLVRMRETFALRDIPKEYRLFEKNNIFVISKDALLAWAYELRTGGRINF